MEVNEIVSRYLRGESLKSMHRESGICTATLRRILITEGVSLRYGSEKADRIQALSQHHTVDEIAVILGIKPKTVAAYLPYTKGSYSIGEKSSNADRIALCRKRKQNKNTRTEVRHLSATAITKEDYIS